MAMGGTWRVSACEAEGVSARTLRIGTRRSRLALAQTRLVADLLRRNEPDINVEIVELSSLGDERPDAPLTGALGVGVFTSRIQKALLDGVVDIAVHSLKDLPVRGTPGIELAAVPAREDPWDALVSRDGLTLRELPAGASVGTGSPRRAAQIKLVRKDMIVKPLRGNVETRVRKLDDGEVDAAVLACAGLIRLQLEDRIGERLNCLAFLPAPGQGALAVETRESDQEATELLKRLDDSDLRACINAERAFLEVLGGGCRHPAGALATVANGRLELQSGIYGETATTTTVTDTPGTAADLGRRAAEIVLAGAGIDA